MASERQKTAALQAELSNAVHLKLEAEGERDRRHLEVQQLNKQLQWLQEQLYSAKEALCRSQKAEMQTATTEPGPDSAEKLTVEGLDQVISLRPVTPLGALPVSWIVAVKKIRHRFTFLGKKIKKKESFLF